MKKWICVLACLAIGAGGCGQSDKKEGPVDSSGGEVETPDAPDINQGTPADPNDLMPTPTGGGDDPTTDKTLQKPGDDAATPPEIDTPGTSVLDPLDPLPGESDAGDTSDAADLDGLDVVALVARLGDARSRDQIAERLTEYGKDAVGELVRALDNEDENVRRDAAFALGTLGSNAASAAAPLRKLAEADTDENVRHAALFAADAVSGN